MVDFQLLVQACSVDEGMSHRNTLRLHGVIFGVDEFPEHRVVEVGNPSIGR